MTINVPFSGKTILVDDYLTFSSTFSFIEVQLKVSTMLRGDGLSSLI